MEEKYDFVEEVIRKKPSRLRMFLKKCLALVGAALFLSAGVLVILFVFRDNLRELLFDGEKQSTAGTKVSVTLADKDDANIESDIVRLEEIINKTLVMIYAGSAQDELLCTGVVMALVDDAYILVPYEKIRGEDEVQVQFWNEEMTKAQFWSHDEELGIAIIKINGSDIDKQLSGAIVCAEVTSVGKMSRGYDCVYEGNAFGGLVPAYTGKIADISETDDIYDLYFRIFYTDVVMDGVEDGFLFDGDGCLLGMVLSKYADPKNSTISAVALGDITGLLSKLLNQEKPGYLGIKGVSMNYEIQRYIGENIPTGLYITEVDNKSTAYQAGIMAGDIIMKIGTEDIENMPDVREAVNSRNPGDSIEIVLKRKIGDTYKKMQINLVIGERN